MNPLAQIRTGEPLAARGSAVRSLEKIGRFEILEEIGKGSMGVVYLARDPMIGRWVAVKKLTGIKGKPLDPEIVRRLLINEARNVGALEHPGIVMVFDLIEDRDGHVEALAMEYIAGKSLRQRLNEPQPFSLKYVSEIISAVAEVLDYAHENGCIHRDIKPANILLAEDGAIKVADFGIAALRGEDLASELRNLGTPNYLAPERVLGQPGDQQTDIYSLGVILYELLTGHPPFEASSIGELVQKIIQEEPTPPERFAPEMMSGLRTILARALAKEPGDRYPTAGALAADVREIVAAHASLNDTVPAPVTPGLGARRRHRPEPEDRLVVGVETGPQAWATGPEALQDEVEVALRSALEPVVQPVGSATDPAVEIIEWEMAAPAPAEPPMRAARAKAHVAEALRAAAAGAATALASIHRSARPAVRPLRDRPVVAAALVFAVALPALLLILGNGDERVRAAEPLAGDAVSQQRRYLGLLEQSRRLYEAREWQAAGDLLVRAEDLFPETRNEVRREALLEIAVAREAERLTRIDAYSETAHLQIARLDFAGAERSIQELQELDAPPEVLGLLGSSLEQSRWRLQQVQSGRAPELAPPAAAEVAPASASGLETVRRPPPKTGPGMLRVEFSSARPRGVLTVYSGDRQILNRPYRFVEKKNFLLRKGVGGSFQETVELPQGTRELKIYLSQPRVATQLRPITVTIQPATTRVLELRVEDDGQLVLGST